MSPQKGKKTVHHRYAVKAPRSVWATGPPPKQCFLVFSLFFVVFFCFVFFVFSKKILQRTKQNRKTKPKNTTKTLFRYSPAPRKGFFHIKTSYSHDPRVGTHIIGPGETVFAITRVAFKVIACKSLFFLKS